MRGSWPSALQVAGRTVHPDLNRVDTAAGPAALEPKVMGVLLCLAERPGLVVTKEELLARVWPDVFVTEDVLVRAVGELRRVFEDDPGHPRVIETIRKRGYRLLSEVSPAASETPPASGAPRRRAPTRVVAGIALGVLLAASLTAAWLTTSALRKRPEPALRFVPLASGPGEKVDPAMSPDGTRVAFVWRRGGDQGVDLFVQLVEGEVRLQLTHDPAIEQGPVWSPDGTQIAFTRLADGRCDVWLISALGGAERRLAACTDPRHFRMDWSPDGRWLALSQRSRPGASPYALQLLDVETLERRAVTTPPPDVHGDELPAFSPDGTELAFVRFVGPTSGDLYRVGTAGGTPERLTTDNLDVTGLDWVDDGRAIVISSDRAGIYSLWRVPAAGGEPSLLAGGGTRMKHPSSSYDGRVIVYESWRYAIGIHETPLDGGAGVAQARRLTGGGDDWNYDPQLSPDGRRLAFVSTRSGSYEIWVADDRGAHEQRLTSFGGPFIERPRWSPDGTQIVLVARPEGNADLWRVDVEGGRPHRLTSHHLDELYPEWAGNGGAVYFSSRRTERWEVYRLALDTGEERQITSGGGLRGAESPDGRSLRFTRPDRPGLWEQPLGGGEPVALIPDLPSGRWTEWSAANDGLYYSRGGLDVLFQPWAGGRPRPVAHLPEQAWPGLDVREGGRVLYARADRRECDLVLITLHRER